MEWLEYLFDIYCYNINGDYILYIKMKEKSKGMIFGSKLYDETEVIVLVVIVMIVFLFLGYFLGVTK